MRAIARICDDRRLKARLGTQPHVDGSGADSAVDRCGREGGSSQWPQAAATPAVPGPIPTLAGRKRYVAEMRLGVGWLHNRRTTHLRANAAPRRQDSGQRSAAVQRGRTTQQGDTARRHSCTSVTTSVLNRGSGEVP
jgi:hypothetical protein